MKATGKKMSVPKTSIFSRGGGFGPQSIKSETKFSKQPAPIRPNQFYTQHKGGN
jgi:hypothetical protein